MSCKALQLNSCEVAGSTFQGRKFAFPARDISGDTFTAKVRGYNVQAIELTGVKTGANVYFSFADLEGLKPGKYVIQYWAELAGIGREMIASEGFTVSSQLCSTCTDSAGASFVLEFPNETVEYAVTPAIMRVEIGWDYLTDEQKAELKGTAFTYDDFTPEQLAGLKGPKGDTGERGLKGDKGDTGEQGIQGVAGNNGWQPLLVADTTTIAGKTLLKLSDWIGGTGTKPNTNVGKWLKGDGTYTDVASEANNIKGAQGDSSKTLVADFNASGALEVLLQEVNISTSTFKKVGHGLINGDPVGFLLNNNVYGSLADVVPSGILINNQYSNVFYVISATSDTFQLSRTSGGSAIVLSENPTMDLSRFHIEKINVLNLTVTNAGVLDNFLIRISNLKTVGRRDLPTVRNNYSSNLNATSKYEINGSSITTVTTPITAFPNNFNNIQYGYVDYIFELVGSQSVIKTDASFFSQNEQGQWLNHVIKGRSLVHGTFISENYLRILGGVANGTRIQVFKI